MESKDKWAGDMESKDSMKRKRQQRRKANEKSGQFVSGLD